MDISFKPPFYAKVALIFISVFAFVYTLHIGQDIIIPIVYATIVAILLNPLVNYLIRKKINKVIAISIAVALAIIAMLGIIYIISSQVTMFSETYPQLKIKLDKSADQFVKWASHKLSISRPAVRRWISDSQSDAVNNFDTGETLWQMGHIGVIITLLPVYLFMILHYKTLLLEFIRKLFQSEHHIAVVAVLTNSKNIIQTYLVGLVFEMLIMAVLNSTGLLLLGIDYAIILGITGAILNIIPYIGGIIAIALPMTIAYVTKESLTYPILVFFIYIFIQFIDNHYIIPKIVASRVKINALVSVIVVLIGGAIWGIPGMFLSIPLTAIIKVICDHIEPLKPWGFLMGNIIPTTSRFSFIKRKK